MQNGETDPVTAPDLLTSRHLEDEAATQALGSDLARLVRPGEVIALFGDLGAGKTTLARSFIRALTTPEEEVPSPTFTLVQTYPAAPCPIWHFDLYRIADSSEIVELGWDEALQSGISLVEWPERLGQELPREALCVTLRQTQGESRDALLRGVKEIWGKRLGTF